MKNSKRIVCVVILFAFSVIGVCAQTQPQFYRTNDRNVSVILQRLERSSSQFRNSLNSALLQSSIDQTRSENDINTFEPGFETALHQFRSQFGRHLEGVADIESVLGQASLINGFMARNRLNTRVHNDWAAVRTDVNGLANSYGVTWDWSRQVPSTTNSSGSLQLSDGDINKLIQRLETGGDAFRTSLTEAFGQTGYAQAIPERTMNDALRGLKRETNQLRIQFDNKQQIVSNVELVIARAAPIDTYLRKNLLTRQVQNDWSSLRADINKLAGAFNLSANWENAGTHPMQ
jgi:hypothetical protein